MHHPVSPQIKKFFLMEKVCPRPLLFIQAMTYNKKYAFFGGVEIQMALYANIIIDISHEKLDRLFQYRVPEELKPVLKIGMQVLVPFGSGGRKLCGYVIELTDQAEYDVRKIKEITEICKDSVAIESQLIALAFWMKKNYGGTMNQALKTVIPIKQKTAAKEKRILVLAADEKTAEEQLAEFRRKHNVARARLLEALIRERELSGDVVKEELNVGLNVVRAMEKLGILKIRTEQDYRNPVRQREREERKFLLSESQQHGSVLWYKARSSSTTARSLPRASYRAYLFRMNFFPTNSISFPYHFSFLIII